MRRLTRRLRRIGALAGVFLAGTLALCGTRTARAADEPKEPSKEGIEFFEKKIRPVLVESCYRCHSVEAKANKKLKGRLYLDSWEGMTKGGESEKASVVPGKLNESLAIVAIRYTDKGTADTDPLVMPPPKEGKPQKLPDEVIKNFEEWVKMGAPHPKDFEKPPAAKAEGPKAGPDAKTASADAGHTAGEKAHWAFVAPKAPPVPKVLHADSVRNAIDNFITSQLEAKGLVPSPSAPRGVLIRRITFDLTGLPPTPAEVEAFVNDSSSNAYEKVVDRLLASPRYGERWGRHWLDVARYSDTKGYVFQEERRYPFAYTYRDWVIAALNADMPYDQFLMKQVAADKMVSGDKPSDKRDLAAMGFLTLGRRFLNQQPDIIDDRIDVVCRGMMALTVGCARCHDHKFDPIPTKDYYSLYGVFASSVEPKDLPEIANADATPTPAAAAFEKELKERQAKVEEFVAKKAAEITGPMRTPKGLAEYLEATLKPDADDRGSPGANDLSRFMVRRWREYLNRQAGAKDPVFAPWRAYAALPADQFGAKAVKVTEDVAAKGKAGGVHPLVAEAFAGKTPGSMHDVAARYGELLAKFDKADAQPDEKQEALRKVLRGPDSPFAIKDAERPMLFKRDSRDQYQAMKRKVDEFIATNPSAPARAMVMVDAPDPGDMPVLVRGNPGNPGSVVRRQFLSAVSGPDRKPFTQGSGRLELAKAIASRDNPLTARVFVNRVWQWHFGQGIVRTPSDFGTRCDPPTHPELLDWLAVKFMDEGWSVKKLQKLIVMSAAYQQASDDRPEARKVDPENMLLWHYPRQRLDWEATRDALLFVSGKLDESVGGRPVDITNPDANRRTVYGFIDRQNMPGVMRAFDFATPDATSPQRFVTTVPQQALFFMNSPFLRTRAKQVTERPDVAGASDPGERVRRLYRLVYGREASEEEVSMGRQFVDGGAAGAWEKYVQVLLEANEFVFVD